MCQYSSQDGFANDWHLVHLGSRAQGGAGLVVMEAAAVLPEGRISPDDLGIWKDEHIPTLQRIASFLHAQGSRAGMQLAHAGRKGSTKSPFIGDGAVPAGRRRLAAGGSQRNCLRRYYPMPAALDQAGINAVIEGFRKARCGCWRLDSILSRFMRRTATCCMNFFRHSPIIARWLRRQFREPCTASIEVVDAVRAEWPEHLPLFVRISATDWAEGGWDIDESVELAKLLREHGVDLVDCSSGGMVPNAKIPVAPGFQVGFAARIGARQALRRPRWD